MQESSKWGGGVERLRRSLSELPSAVRALPPERFDVSPGANEWSAREVLTHLADAEQVYGVRVRMILTGDRPHIAAYDQEAWAARFTALETPELALARWRVLRESLLRILDGLSAEDWKRVGMHEERGPESIGRLTEIMAQHDQDHLAQMREAAAATD